MKNFRTIMAFGLAASLSCQLPVYAQIPDGYDAERWERLNDNRLEYDEIEDRIVNFSPTYLATNQQLEKAYTYAPYEQAAADMRTAVDDLRADLKDAKYAGDAETAAILTATIKAYETGTKSMEKAVNSMRKSIDRTLDTSVKGALVTGTESLMVAYQRLAYATELVDTSVELAQAAYQSTVTQQSIGMATADDVVAAQDSLVSAKAQQASTHYQLNQVKQNICLLAGWDYNADIEIGAIPEPDSNRITGMSLDTDVQKAIGNNYSLSNMRRSGSSGMTVVEKRVRLKQMEEMEEQIANKMNQSYQDVLQAQAAYQAASSAFESAQLTYHAGQRQYQLGMVSALQYQQLRVAYLSQKMSYENAKLDFFQAMEDYDWAVNGLLSLE